MQPTKAKWVIPYNRVPSRYPSLTSALVFPIVQTHYGWPSWTLGVFYTLYAIMFIVGLVQAITQVQVDPFKE